MIRLLFVAGATLLGLAAAHLPPHEKPCQEASAPTASSEPDTCPLKGKCDAAAFHAKMARRHFSGSEESGEVGTCPLIGLCGQGHPAH